MRTEKVFLLTLEEEFLAEHDRLSGLLAELEDEKGPIEAGVMEEVRRAWPAPGRTAGRLLGAARSSSTVDALVVAHAVVGGGAQVLTGDQEDLERLAAPHPEVWIQPL